MRLQADQRYYKNAFKNIFMHIPIGRLPAVTQASGLSWYTAWNAV